MAWDWLKDNNDEPNEFKPIDARGLLDGKEYHDYWATKLHNGLANVPKSLLGAVESIPAMAARTRPVVMQELENDLDGTGLMDSDADKEALSDVENQIKGTTAPIWEGARLGVKSVKDALPDANWESNVDESQLSYPKKIGGMIVENAPLMAAQLAASIINPALGVGLMAGSIAGDAYNDLTEKGVDPLTAGQAGWLDAAAQAPLEGVGEMGWLKAFRELGTDGAAKLMGKAFVKEGLTEAVQEFPDETIPYIAEHGSLDGFDWGQLASNAVDAGVVGGIYGGGFAGIGRAINGKADEQESTGDDSASTALALVDANTTSDNAGGNNAAASDVGNSGVTRDADGTVTIDAANIASPAMHAMNRIVNELGISPTAASGIVGGLMHESGGDTTDISTTAKNPTSGAYGIAQWLGSRYDDLVAFAEENNADPNDLDTQISFIIHELKGKESGALQEILKAQTPDEAGRLADQFYERSEGTDEIRNRKASNAQKIYDMFMNGGADPSATHNGSKNNGVPNPKSAEDFLKDLEETLPADTDEDVEKLNAIRKAIQGKNKKAQEELAAQYGWGENAPETAQDASEGAAQENVHAGNPDASKPVNSPSKAEAISKNPKQTNVTAAPTIDTKPQAGNREANTLSTVRTGSPRNGGTNLPTAPRAQAPINGTSPVAPSAQGASLPAAPTPLQLPSANTTGKNGSHAQVPQVKIEKARSNQRLKELVKQAFVDGDKDALARLGAMQINPDVLEAVKNDVLGAHQSPLALPASPVPAKGTALGTAAPIALPPAKAPNTATVAAGEPVSTNTEGESAPSTDSNAKSNISEKENDHENTKKNQPVHHPEENKNDNTKPEQSKPSEGKDSKTPEIKNPVKKAPPEETPSSGKKEEPQKGEQDTENATPKVESKEPSKKGNGAEQDKPVSTTEPPKKSEDAKPKDEIDKDEAAIKDAKKICDDATREVDAILDEFTKAVKSNPDSLPDVSNFVERLKAVLDRAKDETRSIKASTDETAEKIHKMWLGVNDHILQKADEADKLFADFYSRKSYIPEHDIPMVEEFARKLYKCLNKFSNSSGNTQSFVEAIREMKALESQINGMTTDKAVRRALEDSYAAHMYHIYRMYFEHKTVEPRKSDTEYSMEDVRILAKKRESKKTKDEDAKALDLLGQDLYDRAYKPIADYLRIVGDASRGDAFESAVLFAKMMESFHKNYGIWFPVPHLVKAVARRGKTFTILGTFSPNANAFILSKLSNGEVFAHEATHMYESMLRAFSTLTNEDVDKYFDGDKKKAREAIEKIRADLKAIDEWASYSEEHLREYEGTVLYTEFRKHASAVKRGTDIGERTWRTERLARGFTQYLGEGNRAPTKELQGVFDRIKQWVLDAYGAIKNLTKGKLPPDMEKFYQSMISGDAEYFKNMANRGKSATVRTDDGKEFNVTYKIVPAETLVASNTADFGKNENYPEKLQPRDRDRVSMKEQVDDMARNLRPEDLTASRSVNQGAPLVNQDNVVENGNGRTMAITRAYTTDGDAYKASSQKYKQYLMEHAEEYGYTREEVEAMENPVLIRQRDSSSDSLQDSIIHSTEGGMKMSASQQAKVDAEKISPKTLSLYDYDGSGDLTKKSNNDFVVSALNEIADKSERDVVFNKDGTPSKAGIERVKSALAAYAYGDNSLLERISESTDTEDQNIVKAFSAAAPQVAAIKAKLDKGDVSKDYDLPKLLSDVLDFYFKCKNDGKSIKFALNETSLFGDNPSIASVSGKNLARFIADNIRRPKAISDALVRMTKYIDGANEPSAALFSGEKMGLDEIVRTAVGLNASKFIPASKPNARKYKHTIQPKEDAWNSMPTTQRKACVKLMEANGGHYDAKTKSFGFADEKARDAALNVLEAYLSADSKASAKIAIIPEMNEEIKLTNAGWNGSPGDFSKFDLAFVGSGEGNAAHGWGIYFAMDKPYRDNPDFGREVAERYKKQYGGENGHVYKAAIPSDEYLLDERAKISDQPKRVQNAVLEVAETLQKKTSVWRFEDGIKKVVQYLKDENYDLGNENGDAEQAKIDQALERVARDFYANSNSASPQELKISSVDLKILRAALKEQVRDQAETSAFSSKNLSERDMDQAAKEILYNFLSASRRNQFRTLDALAANIRAEDDSVFKNITSQDLLNKAGEIAGTALREKQIDLGGAREILNVMKQAAEHPTDTNERDVAEGITKAYTDYGIDRATAEKIARRQAAQFFSALRESRAKPIKEILAPLTGYDVQQMFQTAIAKQQLEPSEPVDKAVSMLLKGAGLKGYKYEGATDGHCVVVFDNDAMKIINKFSVKTPYQKMVENITPIASDDLTTREKAIVDFAKKMGLQVQFFEGDPDLHGFHADGTNVAFLNRHSAMDLNQTFWHETFHWMRESNPELYNQMVKEVFGDKVSEEQLADYAASIGRTDMSKELTIEEMLADAMWDASKRGSFFEKLGIEHPSLCAKIIKWIKNLYEDFKAHFHNPQAGLTNTQIKRMSNTLSRIAEKLVDGDGNKLFSVDEKGNIKETAAGKRVVSDEAKAEAERDGSNQKYRVTNRNIVSSDPVRIVDITDAKRIRVKDGKNTKQADALVDSLLGKTFRFIGGEGFVAERDNNAVKGIENPNIRGQIIHSHATFAKIFNDKVRGKALGKLEELLRNGVYIDKHPDSAHGTKTKYIEIFVPVRDSDGLHVFRISARERGNSASIYEIGNALFYNVKKEGDLAMLPSEGYEKTASNKSPSTITIAEMLNGIKDRNNIPYVINGKLNYDDNIFLTKNMLSGEPNTRHSVEDLKAQTLSVFHNAQNIEVHDSGVSFDLPNGSHIEVNFTDETISVDRAKAQKDYSGTLTGNERAAGKIETVGKDAIVTLTIDSPDETVSHEAMHLAWNLLTEKERNALLRTYGNEEGAAEGMREWKIRRKMRQGTITGKIMQKISDIAHKLLSLFRENDQHVFQKLESGEIWERGNENNTAARNIKYKMNPINEAEKYLKSHKNFGEKAGSYIDKTFRPDLANAKANPNISVNETKKKKGWGVVDTALNNTVRSPSRIKSAKTSYIWGLADTAQRELQELRGKWTHSFAGAIKNLNSKEKERYTDILWEEDMKQHVFSDKELRDAGVSEKVIKAHQKTRSLLGRIYNAVNAVYTRERVENFTYKTRKEAEDAKKELAKRPHTFVMHDIRETVKDGKPAFQVSIKTGGYREVHSVVTAEEMKKLDTDKDVYIKSRKQLDDGSFKVSYLAYNKPLANMEGYMPHIFHGVLIVKKYVDEDGNTQSKVVGSAESIDKAVVKADAMQKEDGGEYIIAPKEFSSEGEVENPLLLGDMDYFKLMESLSKGASLTLDEAREMTHATMKGRHVYYGAKKHRKGAEGFEKNAIWAIQHHIDSSSRYVALDPFKQKAISFFERAFGDYNKDWTGEAAFCKGYIDSVLGKPSRLETLANDFLRLFPWFKNEAIPARRMAGNLTGLTGVLKLGASLSSGFVNTLQLFNCVGYVGARKTAVGLKRALHPNAADKKILVASGVSEESGLALDSIGHITAEGTALSKVGNVINSVNNFLMKPFTLAEKTIRKATILAAYYKAIGDGLSKGEAIQYARDINRKVNFDYSVADAPRIFRALQGTVIGDMALQFQKYGVKEMEVISDFLPILGNTTAKQKLEFFIPYLLVSGIWNAFPFEDALLSLLKLLGFGDPEKEAKRAMMEWAGNNADRKALVNVANYGAGAIVGVDISQRVGLKGVVPETSNIVTGGPLGSTTVQLAKAVLNGDTNGAMKAISPAAGNIYGAVAGYNTDSKGRKTVDYDTKDRIVRGVLGFRTIREANATDAQNIVYNYKEKKKNDRAKAKSEYLKDPSSSNRQKLKEMGYSDKEIKALKDDKKSTRVERSQSGLSKEDKKKLKPVFDYVQ